ncbi:MAG: hypothetical protein ABIT71_02640 [Vicinamibacteraceae bacterium]
MVDTHFHGDHTHTGGNGTFKAAGAKKIVAHARVTGGKADLQYMRDFLTALLDFTRKAKAGGQTRETFIKTANPLPGFTDYGPLIERATGTAWDELS